MSRKRIPLDEKDKANGFEIAEDVVAKTRILARQRLPFEKVIDRLNEQLDATMVKAVVPKGEEEFIYSKDMVDNAARGKAIHLGLQLHDLLPSSKHEISGPGGGPIQVDISVFPEQLVKQLRKFGEKYLDDRKRANRPKPSPGR